MGQASVKFDISLCVIGTGLMCSLMIQLVLTDEVFSHDEGSLVYFSHGGWLSSLV
jgi:hypothetical protein